MNITDRQAAYATQLVESFKNQGFRAFSDLRNEKIGYKIRAHTLARIPYLLVVGDREEETQTVAVRTRGGEDKGTMPLRDFESLLTADIASRGR
jgi:threonyl-tRNA synthetase